MKRAASLVLRTRPRLPATLPTVTVFISSLNTRYPLELTLSSLTAQTRYPKYQILVGENASTDGSADFLRQAAQRWNIQLLSSPISRLHSDWLNEVAYSIKSTYWVAVDSDMFFFSQDWLADLIVRMEHDPDLYLLAAERNAPEVAVREPVSHEIIDSGEKPSTWLFCVRSSLRDHLEISFDFHKTPGQNGRRTFCFDTGGYLLSRMRAVGLRYDFMPIWYRWKYHHFGSLSWVNGFTAPGPFKAFKEYQLQDIRRRLRRRL